MQPNFQHTSALDITVPSMTHDTLTWNVSACASSTRTCSTRHATHPHARTQVSHGWGTMSTPHPRLGRGHLAPGHTRWLGCPRAGADPRPPSSPPPLPARGSHLQGRRRHPREPQQPRAGQEGPAPYVPFLRARGQLGDFNPVTAGGRSRGGGGEPPSCPRVLLGPLPPKLRPAVWGWALPGHTGGLAPLYLALWARTAACLGRGTALLCRPRQPGHHGLCEGPPPLPTFLQRTVIASAPQHPETSERALPQTDNLGVPAVATTMLVLALCLFTWHDPFPLAVPQAGLAIPKPNWSKGRSWTPWISRTVGERQPPPCPRGSHKTRARCQLSLAGSSPHTCRAVAGTESVGYWQVESY